jgi:phospholipid/cholesterol/gamma-HCH transport system ATP-binding protein
MIEIKNLYKSFGDVEVLKNISTVFHPGVMNMVIGASGSGKSVMMKNMVGLIRPTTGDILYDNRSFLSLDDAKVREIRKEIGMLFQGTALFDSLTVEENVEFPLSMFTDMTPAERRERVDFCLSRVNLSGVNDQYPAEISGGMMKRVGIARAIALNIRYLFCDEPNSGLDPITSRVVDKLIKEITEEYNITTIINSHDMKSVFDYGDHIIFIYKGEKTWEGSRRDIKDLEPGPLKDFLEASFFK